MHRSYVNALLLSGVLVVLLAAALNYVVDPYGMYRRIDMQGFNSTKPKSGPNSHLTKPYRIEHVRPKSVILGNSRAEAGIDPQSSHWPPNLQPVFNMALPAAGIETALRSLQHAIVASKPDLVVLGVDFFDFMFDDRQNRRARALVADPSAFDLRLLVNADGTQNKLRFVQSMKDHATTMFSLSTLTDSLQTVVMQRLTEQADLTNLGFNPMNEFRRFVRVDGQHTVFQQVETTYLTNYLRLRYAIYDAGTASSIEFDKLRALVDLCRAARIRLVIYIHPYHAHILESYRIAGLWPLFEEWKRALVRILDEDAHAHPGAQSTILWDFSGYNDITTERVPTASERGRTMRWYWEAGHYNREVGNLVLARILGSRGTTVSGPATFGVELNAQNIESQLATIREDRKQYAGVRPEEIAALEKLGQSIRAQLKSKKDARQPEPVNSSWGGLTMPAGSAS